MLLKDIQPFVRHIRHFPISDVTPSAGKNVRTRDNRIFFVTDGQGYITVDDRSYSLKRDTLVLIKAGETYRIDPDKKLTVTVINFDFTENFSHIKQSFSPFSADFPGVLEDISFSDTSAFSSHAVVDNGACFADRIRSLIGGFYDSDEWRDAFLSATLKAIIIDIARSAADTAHSRKRSPLVDEVIRYMREHYSERVENETLSKHFHFTSVYINRLFKQETGISLHKYLIALRVDVAKELIASGEYSPSEAAIATGFEDYPHFSKTFKALTGKSPTDYREAFTLKTNP